MLVQELRAEFNPYFASLPAWLILWLDEKGEWDGVVDRLAGEFEVVRYQGSLMELKARVEFAWQEGRRPRFILYVPKVGRENLGVLKEYEFMGRVFDSSIAAKLREWGMEFDRQTEQEIAPMLPLLAREHATAGRQVWGDILKSPMHYLVEQMDVLDLLADPVGKCSALRSRGKWEIMLSYMAREYGGPSPAADKLAVWPEEFTAYLILTEAFYKNGGPGSFPTFRIRPAEEIRHRACLDLLRQWLNHTTFKDDFKRLSRRVEEMYDLTTWAEGLPQAPHSEASLKVAEAWARRILATVQKAGTVAALRQLLGEQRTAVDTMAEQFWSREGDVPIWRALQAASRVTDLAQTVDSELSGCAKPADYAKRYTESWWELDRTYRKFRAQFDAQPELHNLVLKVRQAYNEAVRKMNEAFIKSVQQAAGLELGMDTQASFWAENVAPGKGIKAVLFIDALRYEMGRELAGRVEGASVSPMVAALPTITPVGMSALCPGAITLSADGAGLRVASDVVSNKNLVNREARESVIKRKHPKARFFELDALVHVQQNDLADTNLVVGFSTAWDAEAHSSGALTLSLGAADSYLDLVAKVIRKLGGLGVEKIWLVADHGFIVIDDLSACDEVPLPTQPAPVLSGYRYLLSEQPVAMSGVVFLDLPLAPGLKLGVPAGLGVFGARGGKEYFHGGLSLQEVIVPVVAIQVPKAEGRYEAVLQVDDRITNAIFPVRVLRKDPLGRLVGASRFVFISGILVHKEGEKETETEIIRTEHSPIEITSNATSYEARLKIGTAVIFSRGDRLRLNLLDAQTEHRLDHRELTIDVESGF